MSLMIRKGNELHCKHKVVEDPRPKNDSPNRFLNGLSNPPIFSNKIKIKQTLKKRICFIWWAGVDSNHRSRRRQIYSLLPLATREPTHIKFTKKWSWWTDSNPRPADYKSAALPTELHQRLNAWI